MTEDHAVSDKTPPFSGPAPAARASARDDAREVLERIRHLAGAATGSTASITRTATSTRRARRQFGSWATAVAEAGVDYARA